MIGNFSFLKIILQTLGNKDRSDLVFVHGEKQKNRGGIVRNIPLLYSDTLVRFLSCTII
jgi:hypothetical protein